MRIVINKQVVVVLVLIMVMMLPPLPSKKLGWSSNSGSIVIFSKNNIIADLKVTRAESKCQQNQCQYY